MNVWKKIAKVPDYFKLSEEERLLKLEKEFDETGELKNIKTVEKKYLRRKA